MKADRECFECCKNKVKGLLGQNQVSETVSAGILRQVDEILAHAGNDLTAPELMAETIAVVEQQIGLKDAYEEPKRKYNNILLDKEKEIAADIEGSADMFLSGVQYAVTGNYIDFGAMSDVNEEKLNELLADHKKICLDETELLRLREDIAEANRLLYIVDNTGEVVLDKVFIQVLKKLYPSLEIGVLVRGCPILNDVTMADAQFVGLTDIVKVISNGTGVPGTLIESISEEAREWMDTADLCIAKGQGNFETLRGCGKNIYYLFLCKCELFVKKFGVERFAPVLSNEKRIVQNA